MGAALADKKRSLREQGPRALVLAQRAHSCADQALSSAEVARTAEAARGAFVPSSSVESLADASMNELYRQASYWALCAFAANSDEQAGRTYNEALWDTLDEELLTKAAKDRAPVLRASLREGSFVYFAELPANEQVAISGELRKLAESLIAKLDQPGRAVRKVLQQRAWRSGLILLVLALLSVCLVWLRRERELRSDLAPTAAWRTSSKIEGSGCVSPAQKCAESPGFFFHTLEEKEPWIEFDLHGEHEISALQIENRPDCCPDRSFPLIVETSEDHKQWKSVAQQDNDFKTWRATFSTVKARWVRLRVNKVAYLHLNRVRIFP